MSVTPIILLIALLVLGVHWESPVLFVGFTFLLSWLVVSCFAKVVRWGVGLTAVDRSKQRPGRSRVCMDPRCGKMNIAHARFCAQCGRRLV